MPRVLEFLHLIKTRGLYVRLFDCTFYQDINFNNLGVTADEERVKIDLMQNR